MNWTSTQYTAWTEQCRAFASARLPFRLDHIYGLVEEEFCDGFCAEHNYWQEKRGSSALFTPNQN
jgi:hypothetical protein